VDVANLGSTCSCARWARVFSGTAASTAITAWAGAPHFDHFRFTAQHLIDAAGQVLFHIGAFGGRGRWLTGASPTASTKTTAKRIEKVVDVHTATKSSSTKTTSASTG
jgi:hypothetical protein